MAQTRNKKTGKKPSGKPAKPGSKKPADLDKKVSEVLEKVRPYIKMHGGDVSLVSIKEGVVTLFISGACSHCSLADMTYNTLISGLLKQEVPGIVDIKLVK